MKPAFSGSEQIHNEIMHSAFRLAAQHALLEACSLLRCRKMPEAADAIHQHWGSILIRTAASLEASMAITKAQIGD